MNKDFSELIDYLDKKFSGIDSEFAEVRSDIAKIYDGLDAYAKKADTYFQEMLMLANKVDRHERWLHQVAEKLGVKLEY